jgi:glycosyltransferase involved in cell wall biosynthesis
VLCLPSYREGFGSVIIEAAACGVPAIGSRIYGITDAINENVTGLMHEAGNISELQIKLEQMATDRNLREKLGKNAYHRAINEFSSELITQAWCDFYSDVIFKND